jgi:uncharacterized protein (TIGR02246 family)
MRIARLFVSVAAAVLATGVASATAQAKDPALDKMVADWGAAFGRGDAKALATLYTDNAIRVSPDGGTVLGRAAIEKEFAGYFAGPWKGATIKILVGSVQPLGPDVSAAEGTYEVTPKGPDGKALPPVKGRYLNTMVKKGGAWVLSSNAAVIPAPPAK